MSDIANWLGQIGLEQYASLFADNDIDTDVVSELTDDDLKELGLNLGERRRLQRACRELASSVETAAVALDEAVAALQSAAEA